MIGSSKRITEKITRQNASERQKKKPGLSANRLSNNWAQNIIDENPCLRKSRLSNQKHVVYHMMVFGRFQVVCIPRYLVRQQKLHLVFHRCRKGLSSYSVFSLTWPASVCIFIGTKESVYIRKEFNSHRTGLGHKYGRHDVM